MFSHIQVNQCKMATLKKTKYSFQGDGEHPEILATFIKLHILLRSLFCQFLSGRLTHILLYIKIQF